MRKRQVNFLHDPMVLIYLMMGAFFGTVLASDLLGTQQLEALVWYERLGIMVGCSIVIAAILVTGLTITRRIIHRARVNASVNDALTRWPHR